MTEEISADITKKTRESLEKFIKKPPLTDKLLKKPPFRFLHDIITNIIHETGFLDGLYSSTEMKSENIKERDMKIAFLQKLIDTMKLISGIKISARPSKIIAGLEPIKTNQLLQAIGLALEKHLDSTEAVSHITGLAAPQTTVKNIERRKSKTDVKKKVDDPTKKISSDDQSSRRKKVSPRNESEIRKKADSLEERKGKDKIIKKQEKKNNENPKEKETINVVKQIDKEYITDSENIQQETKSLDETKSEELLSKEKMVPTDSHDEKISPRDKLETQCIKAENIKKPSDDNGGEPEAEAEASKPFSPEPMMSKKEMIGRAAASVRPASVRPSSARPGAPRVRERPESALVSEQPPPASHVHLILEQLGDGVADDEETVVVVQRHEEQQQQQEEEVEMRAGAGEVRDGQQGRLVSRILEQLGETQGQQPGAGLGVAPARTERRAAAEEARLRHTIQTLTRAANPLGKLVNFLHEDVDSMQTELKMWIDINQTLKNQIKIKKR